MIRNAYKNPYFFPKNKNKTKRKSMQTMRAYLLESGSILINKNNNDNDDVDDDDNDGKDDPYRRVMILDEKHTKLSMSY